MASLVLRSAGRALGRSVPQGSSRRLPVSDFVGKTQSSKLLLLMDRELIIVLYSTSSSCLAGQMDELSLVIGVLKNEIKELELVLERKAAIRRRYGPVKMLAGVTAGFALGFYTNQRVNA